MLGGGKDEYVRPKSVHECQQAMKNYRSALQRVWPWDWTGDALIKAVDDFGWLYYVQVSLNPYLLGFKIKTGLFAGSKEQGEEGALH